MLLPQINDPQKLKSLTIGELAALAEEIRLEGDAKQWLDAILECADITELDAATLNRLIREIVVHEHIDDDKTRHISIEIHFNLKPIPELAQVTS